MQKVACIFSFKLSSWVSCQKIVFNLHKAYQLNKDLELLNFNYSVDQTQFDWAKTAEEIIAAAPDVILILDHQPHPNFLLQIVLPSLAKKPRIIFHIFGDFTLYYSNWDQLSKLLVGHQVSFIVASERQKILIDKFLPEDNKTIVCPFPVDESEFNYQPSLRNNQRKIWGVKEKDFVFVFSGRLSRQKRIHTLIRAFDEFLTRTGAENAYLFFYGSSDHIGDTFIGKWEVEGEYFRKINRLFHEISKKNQSKIRFMGSVPNTELRAIYQAADSLVNLSVHNDEDFGMSVAEAQCSGLPSILTDWGGLASFYHSDLPQATSFIDVSIGERNKLISYSQTVNALEKSFKSVPFKDRHKLSDLALKKFGVQAASEIIKSIMSLDAPSFSAFSPLFSKVIRRSLFNHLPYLDNQRRINKLYRELYSAYVRPHSKSI
jgi:glycosyltransferase involved in cell wall biosynthesis